MIVTLERSSDHRVIKRLTNAQALDILNLRALARLFNLNESTLHYRLRHGYSLEDALTTPVV